MSTATASKTRTTCDIRLLRPPKTFLSQGMMQPAISFLSSVLEDIGIPGQWGLHPYRQLHGSGVRRFYVRPPLPGRASVMVDFQTGDNSTRWSYFLTPPLGTNTTTVVAALEKLNQRLPRAKLAEIDMEDPKEPRLEEVPLEMLQGGTDEAAWSMNGFTSDPDNVFLVMATLADCVDEKDMVSASDASLALREDLQITGVTHGIFRHLISRCFLTAHRRPRPDNRRCCGPLDIEFYSLTRHGRDFLEGYEVSKAKSVLDRCGSPGEDESATLDTHAASLLKMSPEVDLLQKARQHIQRYADRQAELGRLAREVVVAEERIRAEVARKDSLLTQRIVLERQHQEDTDGRRASEALKVLMELGALPDPSLEKTPA